MVCNETTVYSMKAGVSVSFIERLHVLQAAVSNNSANKTYYPDSLSGRMVCLVARVSTRMNYPTN